VAKAKHAYQISMKCKNIEIIKNFTKNYIIYKKFRKTNDNIPNTFNLFIYNAYESLFFITNLINSKETNALTNEIIAARVSLKITKYTSKLYSLRNSII
jgi:hypothetical protein